MKAIRSIEELEAIAGESSGAYGVLLNELRLKENKIKELEEKNSLNERAIAELSVLIATK